jgi:hypothetical protein
MAASAESTKPSMSLKNIISLEVPWPRYKIVFKESAFTIKSDISSDFNVFNGGKAILAFVFSEIPVMIGDKNVVVGSSG